MNAFIMRARLFFDIIEEKTGFLWLDVEGNSINALRGMKRTLKKIEIAKIECEYSSQEGQWKRNLFQVINFMITRGFTPHSGYLHPISRGDMIFIRWTSMNLKSKTSSVNYSVLVVFLYGFVYPIIDITRKFINKFGFI
jgi:hypothetical protein